MIVASVTSEKPAGPEAAPTDLLVRTRSLMDQVIEKEPAVFDSALEKGLAIAFELQKLQSDTETIATALIYPMFTQSAFPLDVVTKKTNESVAKLLVGTKRMDTIDHMPMRTSEFSQQQNFVDNLRKMLLAMVDDIRIVLIKLAERLVTLRYCRNEVLSIQQSVAEKVMTIYAPLANRLGIGQFKWQMEDWAFRYLDPENYRLISKSLNRRRAERETDIDRMIEQLKKLLAHSTLKKFNISGRAKHIYSIFRKLQRKQVDLSEIYDTSAVRILVPTIEDCYTALGLVHTRWNPIDTEFDDYIAKPKDNGYRSIHTAVVGPDERPVEIQIRTEDMHFEAELGVAAHWKYKEGEKKRSNYEEKITWLREVMNWQKEMSLNIKNIKWHEIFEDRIYVFTPNGDVIDLTTGATPLDFAYRIHTQIGHRCRGAKVNNVMVPLTRSLQTGDRVEILTTKEEHPSRDWLTRGYLKTRQAQQKVRWWFYKKDSERELATKLMSTEPVSAAKPSGSPKNINGDYSKNRTRSIKGIRDVLTRLASCCHPLPGDPIIGYITQSRGISIHHQNCFNAKQALKYRPHRVTILQWGDFFRPTR